MVLLDFFWWKAWQCLVVLRVEIFLIQNAAIDKDLTVSHLDRFARQTDHAFYITFIRLARIPENDYIAAADMSPTDALYLVINELVDQQSFAVVKFGQH